ncbi:Zn-ribbon domain-containing OB-fold protein [Geoglobus acetivorans]|uniref:DUF35 domain-containing protein n=1 Tax=Geoglobus acetivorans TaxID=565033 RepID=A0A0A7GDF9_GEOAI|nr:hypothetical protein GACE_0793 [Geoglobus acetivorans]
MGDDKFTIESRQFVIRHRIPATKTERYWKGMEEGKIYATVCRNCGKAFSPPQADCNACYTSDMEWVEVKGEGVVEALTRIHSIPQGFEFKGEPYTIAVARFGAFRVMGWFEGSGGLRVGEKVRARTGRDETGVWKVYFEKVG